MKYYSKVRDSPGHTDVFVDGEVLKPRRDILRISGGFSWGYAGSGPAQLSLAILAEEFNSDIAKKYHQFFKHDVIAAKDQSKCFELTSEEIRDWFQ